MPKTRYFYGAAHEGFGPSELIAQAVAAEEAGFGRRLWHAAIRTYGDKVLPAVRGEA